MTRVEYRVTRPEDFVRFGLILHEHVRAIGWTAWAGRRAVGLGGVVLDTANGAMGHFAATDDYRDAVLRGLHRRTLKLLHRLSRTRIKTIWATCQPDVPRASAWLDRLGFQPTDDRVFDAVVHVKKLRDD